MTKRGQSAFLFTSTCTQLLLAMTNSIAPFCDGKPFSLTSISPSREFSWSRRAPSKPQHIHKHNVLALLKLAMGLQRRLGRCNITKQARKLGCFPSPTQPKATLKNHSLTRSLKLGQGAEKLLHISRKGDPQSNMALGSNEHMALSFSWHIYIFDTPNSYVPSLFHVSVHPT